jgi:hypothetical protein
MINKPVIDLSQLKDVDISFKVESGMYQLSIRYLDNSKYDYVQKNYAHNTEEDCIEHLNDILKHYDVKTKVSSFNFTNNPQTNVEELSTKMIAEISKLGGRQTLLDNHNINSFEDMEELIPNTLFKIRNTYFELKKNNFVILNMLDRTGSIDLNKNGSIGIDSPVLEKEKMKIKKLLTGDNKDLISFFILENSNKELVYIEEDSGRIRDFTLDSKNNSNQSNNLK